MKKIIVSGPVLSRSGYGEMARFALRSLRKIENEYDIYVIATSWGNTGWLFEDNEERRWIDSLIGKTTVYHNQTNNMPEYDFSIQVSIPNEWKKIAKYNIGYTAGIETNMISPAWLEPSEAMDKIIVISEHAKAGFVNTTFGNKQGQVFKINKPIDVIHLPFRNIASEDFELKLKYDFNFLSVCQWGVRKNLEQTIVGFIEEFKNEEVGLVLKVNNVNDSNIDKEFTEKRLKDLLINFPDRKCSITLLHGHLSDAQMTSLYLNPKIKAIISTTHGEGYGLPLMEAAANGLPVIATDWSGHLDFLTFVDESGKEKRLFGKVEYELKPIQAEHVWNGVLEAETSWAYPKMSSFKDKLRDCYKDHGRYKSNAKKLSTFVLDKLNENKLFDLFLEKCLNEKINEISLEEIPKISIITSLYKADEHLEGFMKDITSQSIFNNKCELILLNANSPGNEDEIIKPYLEKYSNIIYKKLDNDPGIYAVWNMGIKMSSGDFITNANVDDRKSPLFIETLAKQLLVNNEIEVVYADNLLTNSPNETWDKNTAKGLYPSEKFSLESMLRGNPPHCMPMWRKKLHDKFGFFEEKYRSASDWEFWLRCAFGGTKMLKINKPLGLYYFNPKGMSTNEENKSWKREEEKEIFKKYLELLKQRKI